MSSGNALSIINSGIINFLSLIPIVTILIATIVGMAKNKQGLIVLQFIGILIVTIFKFIILFALTLPFNVKTAVVFNNLFIYISSIGWILFAIGFLIYITRQR